MSVPTYNDWTSRLDRLQDQVLQIGQLVNSYEKHTRASKDLITTVNRLENEKGTLENKKQDAEEAAATYDREFIERKDGQEDPMTVNKVYTVQDFTTFFLFISYCIFILAMALTLENKLQVIISGILVFVIVVVFLYRFG